jgi:hypothetical protein
VGKKINSVVLSQTHNDHHQLVRDYFIDGPGTAEEQIDHVGQPSTYAGQKSILALAMPLNRNIMVTVGGDLNNRVATYENSFTPDQAHPHIHKGKADCSKETISISNNWITL